MQLTAEWGAWREPFSTLAALAGFTAHLAEVGSAAELKFEHQGAVGNLIHILAFCKRGQDGVGWERKGCEVVYPFARASFPI